MKISLCLRQLQNRKLIKLKKIDEKSYSHFAAFSFTLFENYQKKVSSMRAKRLKFTESLGVQEWWTNRTFFRPQLHGKRRGLCSSERKKHFKWVYKGRKALEKLRRDFSEAIQTPKATWKSNSLYYSCLLCWESRWLQLQILKKVNASEASILL